MTKEALKKALEAFGEIEWSNNSQWQSDRAKVAITAIKEALANEALEKMAENARELGLDYEPAQTEQHQDWCASLTQMLMSMPPKPAPCNCKPKPEQPKVRTGNCLRVGVCASEGHKIAPQRTWIGLTNIDYAGLPLEQVGLVRWAEAKLRSKNESKN